MSFVEESEPQAQEARSFIDRCRHGNAATRAEMMMDRIPAVGAVGVARKIAFKLDVGSCEYRVGRRPAACALLALPAPALSGAKRLASNPRGHGSAGATSGVCHVSYLRWTQVAEPAADIDRDRDRARPSLALPRSR